ncbi:hypothetical protein jhhlp_003095 [Lomentospora prolificans]|uniref:GED domain-containing protein n=1 Tax=Lomentospora prolificans TaxID=41688 RepID=A0A2N3NFX1_9PEZI|nr:hypothetical protein jhhlp_003095 [Lomentospora prolificans]
MARIKKEPASLVDLEEMDNASSYAKESTNQPSLYSAYRDERANAPTPSERRFDEPPLVLQVNDVRMSRPQKPPVNPTEPIPFMNGSFDRIAKNLQYLNDTLGDLHSLGIQHDIQLPKLVLVGDQSAGKSSLMSGLAGINLPRSGGVCTRCVTHIRISRHHTWQCRVSLRQKYGFFLPPDGIVSLDDVTPGDRFPPWKPMHEKILDFKTLDRPDEIEDTLRWAQLAILNPSKPHEHYIPGSGHATIGENAFEKAAENTEAKFSPNVISLEIKHPDFADLSFYDLPGVFVRPGNPDENYLVQVVRNLAEEYVKHREAIIIWAVPMNLDPMNSTMSKIIEDSNALDRTIGVMTKADLLPRDEGALRQWCDILKGDSHVTGHGYYVTSRRPDETLEEQNRWEDVFFDDAQLWPHEFRQYRDRCGLKQLHFDLSDKLGAAFAKSLPTIKKKIVNKLSNARQQLESLPELPANVELEVRTSLRTFNDLVESSLRGNEFSSNYQRLGEAFRNCLIAMKPKINVKDDNEVIEILDDDDPNDQAGPATHPKRKASDMPPPTPITPSKRPRMSNNPSPVKREEPNGRIGSVTPGPSGLRPAAEPPNPFAEFGPPPSKRLRDISDAITRHTRPGQPGLVAGAVYEDLCRQAVHPWEGPVRKFLHLVMKEVRAVVHWALDRAFAKLKKRLIYKRAKEIMVQFLNDEKLATEQYLAKTLQIHTRQLFTLNDEEFKRYRRTEENILRRHRHYIRWQTATGEVPPKAFSPLESLSAQEREQDEKRRAMQLERMGKDPFETEVDVFSYVRGYYRLASARLTDTVALILHSDTIPAIETKLAGEYHLERQLGVFPSGDGEIYDTLMSEDEATAKLREEVRADVKKFERALESISQLEARSGLDGRNGEQDSDHTIA